MTGGAGYIGSHTCVELLNAGYEVIIVDSLINSRVDAVNRVGEIAGRVPIFHETDILDTDAIEQIFSKNSIDAVIHFAGLKAVGESNQSPLTYFRNNVSGTIGLLEIMRMYDVKTLVYSSSATVYGENTVPFTEEMSLSAINPYGRTKLMAEEILNDLYHSDSSWRICKLRYFNPIGAHESGKIGENPIGIPNNLAPYISQVASGKLNKLPIYGSDYDTDDGTCIRDYIHVVDLAFGHMKALQFIQQHGGNEVFNLGTGKGHSVLEVVQAFELATGSSIPYELTARRSGDMARMVADSMKAREFLGFEAVRSLKDMCVDTWRFQQLNPNGYL